MNNFCFHVLAILGVKFHNKKNTLILHFARNPTFFCSYLVQVAMYFSYNLMHTTDIIKKSSN